MSGGSHNYIYISVLNECSGQMYDEEMNDLIDDLCDVLHDLEWWQSADIGEETYRKTVKEFKNKWLKTDKADRLKKFTIKQLESVSNKIENY